MQSNSTKQDRVYFWRARTTVHDRRFGLPSEVMVDEAISSQYRYDNGIITIECAEPELYLKHNEMCVENVPNVITAACVLHNICETHHEHFNETWIQSSNEEYEQPITTVASRDSPSGPPQDIRNALVQYFQHD